MKRRWIREDQLAADLSNDDYDDWYIRSKVVDGIRIGPNFPLPPIEAIETNCRYCGAQIWAQPDNGEPACDPCDQIDLAHFRNWAEIEEQFVNLTGAEER